MKEYKLLLCLICAFGVLSNCNTREEFPVETISEEEVKIEFIRQKVISYSDVNNANGRLVSESHNVLELTLQQESMRPEGFFMDGLPLTDDGKGYDRFAGDGVYTSPSFPKIDDPNGPKPDLGDWYIKCEEFDIIGPGDKCSGKTREKSLIFKTRPWFCICAEKCSMCIGSSC